MVILFLMHNQFRTLQTTQTCVLTKFLRAIVTRSVVNLACLPNYNFFMPKSPTVLPLYLPWVWGSFRKLNNTRGKAEIQAEDTASQAEVLSMLQAQLFQDRRGTPHPLLGKNSVTQSQQAETPAHKHAPNAPHRPNHYKNHSFWE